MMTFPLLSTYFAQKSPSAIRMAQMEFAKRTDGVDAINVSIGNVSLPMHPAMQERMKHLGDVQSPFAQGIVQYSQTVGLEETRQSFLNAIAAGGYSTEGLFCQITDGGSQAMELVILGVSDVNERPILLIDPAYTNYLSFAERTSRNIITITRKLQEDGQFTLPSKAEIQQVIEQHQPSAMIVIPYDNPTGQLYSAKEMKEIAELCCTYNMWMISDEAYREMHYASDHSTSIRGITDNEVPGIQGRRISIESVSKARNACGLRIGALITDNPQFHEKAVAENTTSLCSNVIGQYIFGAIAHESKENIQKRHLQQQEYYGKMLGDLSEEFKRQLPGCIISRPDASIYAVIDVRNICTPDFDAKDFVLYCAQQGKVEIDGKYYTVLTSPMAGFYREESGKNNPGRTQMRISFVESPVRMQLVPKVFAQLFHAFSHGKDAAH